MALDDYMKKQVMEIMLYIFIGLVFTIILPLIGGFSLKGFEESFSGAIEVSSYLGQYLVYLFLIIGSLFLIIFPICNLLFIKKGEHPATQPNPKWYRIFTVSYIFNPEDGALWQLSEALGLKKNFMKWSRNILRVIVVATIFFMIYGLLIVSSPNLSIAGVPHKLPQQLSTSSDIIFGSALPSFSENGVLCIILFFFLGILAYFTAKLKDKKMALLVFFLLAIFIISPLMGLSWMSFHSIVYGNSEASLFATFLFGTVGSILTISTGIFLFWFLWHFFNNFFLKLSETFIAVSEDIYLFTILALVILIALWITTEIIVYKRKKKGIITEG